MTSDRPNPDTNPLGPARPRPVTGDTLGACAGPTGDGGPPLDLTGVLAPPMTPGELGWLAHYRVLKVLGRGGMGAVFQAEDTHLQRVVALKVILPEYAAQPGARD